MKRLVVAEKPSVGMDLAKILGCTEKKKGYIEGEQYIVTWAVGHLVGLKYPEEHDAKYKKWELNDLPLKFALEESLKILPETAGQFQIIKGLINRPDVESIINAGDAGREGYLIQSWIYRMSGNKKPVKVLWASSFTEEAVKEAFLNLKEDFLFASLLEEAEARALADHFIGINYSRALALLYKRVLAYGRCQTPLLNIIVQRDRDIASFVSKPFYNVQIEAISGEKAFKAILVTEERKRADLEDLEVAQRVVDMCKGQSGTVLSVAEKEISEYPPLLYNLAALQKEMGKKFGYTPDKTLELAQKLYDERKILSYPRTESQYLSMDIYHLIDQHLSCCSFGRYEPMISRIDKSGINADKRYINDHKVTDHYALIPTANRDMGNIYVQLSDDERNVFDAVLIRFISIFYPAFKYKEQEILLNIHNFLFLSKAKRVLDPGYRVLGELPENADYVQIENGEKIQVQEIELLQKKTEPPRHYTVDSLIAVMEKYGIGTAATRAEIIKKLQNPERKFVKMEKKSYISTELGRDFIDLIPERLKDARLTQNFEEQLLKVNDGSLTKAAFLASLETDFIENMNALRSGALQQLHEEADSIGKCPLCGRAMRESTKNYFCSGYKEGCKFSIGKIILGKTLTVKQIKVLLNDGQTKKIDGFVSKSGKKFSAQLKLDENKSIQFVF